MAQAVPLSPVASVEMSTIPSSQEPTIYASQSPVEPEGKSAEENLPTRLYLDLPADEKVLLFKRAWSGAVSDSRLDLFGFRRHRTVQLMNLRLLEEEMNHLHNDIIAVGLNHGDMPVIDRLGLGHAEIKSSATCAEDIMNEDFIARLRRITKEYNEALITFNHLMSMETFCLADNISHTNPITPQNAHTQFKIRVLRTDQPLRRTSRDPVQHFLRKCFRRIRYWWILTKQPAPDEERKAHPSHPWLNTYIDRIWGNTTRVAEILSRFLIGLIAGAALVVPLYVLSYQPTAQSRLLVVIISIIVFCLIVSTLSKATHYESMAASAAYAAVLTVFLSNTPGP